MKEFENPANVKKSFEMRLKGDSSDEGNEVYIVQDEADDEQNNLFVEPTDMQFDEDNKDGKDSDEKQQPKRKKRLSSSDDFEKIEHPDKELMMTNTENPFKNTLANSDVLPETKKLDTVIVDNYLDTQASRMGSFTQKLSGDLTTEQQPEAASSTAPQ